MLIPVVYCLPDVKHSVCLQVRSRGVSAAERSALLLQKLQQKHSKSAVLKPALMPDATVSAGRETGHRKPTAARQMQRQLHSLPQMPATISNSSTVAGRHVVESRAASHSTEPPVAIIAHHTAMSGQAASANAPVRTRAEGGRKRRR